MGAAYVTALSLIAVAVISSIVGPVVASRLRRSTPADLDLVVSMSEALSDAHDRIHDLEIRLARCEEHNKLREERS